MSIKIYNNLMDIASDVQWHQGKIIIEVYSVCRERILQQGSTNTKTIDFETSQNLIVGIVNKDATTIEVKDPSYCNFLKQRLKYYKLFNETHDTITKYEVPNRMKYTHTVTIPKTGQDLLMKPTRINEKHLLPGATGLEATTKITLTHTKQLLTASNKLQKVGVTYGTQGFREMQSYPGLVLGQPLIADHTGEMKFQYMVRVTTIMDTTITLKHDNYNADDEWRNADVRQQTSWPHWDWADQSKTDQAGTIILFPYKIHS